MGKPKEYFAQKKREQRNRYKGLGLCVYGYQGCLGPSIEGRDACSSCADKLRASVKK
jgi:hypothetical protein